MVSEYLFATLPLYYPKKEVVVFSATVTLNDSSDTGDIEDRVEPMAGISIETCPRRKHRRVRAGTEAFIPHNNMQSLKLLSRAIIMKLTPSQNAVFPEAVVWETGGDTSKVYTS